MANPRKTFSKIYDQYVDKIYRFIFLKVNSQDIAEDLCSETFLRGWKAFKRFQNPGSDSHSDSHNEIKNIQAFIYQIARNLVIDHYREKGRTQIISAENVRLPDPRPNLEEKALLKSDLETVRLALTKIKEDYQTVIIWHYLDELSVPEIAEILGKSEKAVRVTLHRALKALRNELNLV